VGGKLQNIGQAQTKQKRHNQRDEQERPSTESAKILRKKYNRRRNRTVQQRHLGNGKANEEPGKQRRTTTRISVEERGGEKGHRRKGVNAAAIREQGREGKGGKIQEIGEE
jgi:hypothetical protein